jgi:AraC-like DNA-binding protein
VEKGIVMRSIPLDVWALVNLLGVIQGFFLACIFLFHSMGQNRPNRILGWLLLAITLTVGEIFGCYSGLIAYCPHLVNVTEPLDFLIGPLLYFYTRSLVQPDFFVWRRQWPHFVPSVVFFISRLPYLLQSAAFKAQDVELCYHRPVAGPLIPAEPIWWFPAYNFGGVFMDSVLFPHILVYQILSLMLAYRFSRQHQESLWQSSNRSLRWLFRLLVGQALLLVAAVVISFASSHDTGDIYIATVWSLVFYGLSGIVIKESAVFSPSPLVQGQAPDKKKYGKSGLASEQATALAQKLLDLMAREKPYLSGDLTLPQLAAKLHSSPHHLSQLLNGQLGKSFPDLLNEYRTQELKAKLADPKLAHLKIEELALDSGFNSKSVYNAVFKKLTGQTPSQFRNGANG